MQKSIKICSVFCPKKNKFPQIKFPVTLLNFSNLIKIVINENNQNLVISYLDNQ